LRAEAKGGGPPNDPGGLLPATARKTPKKEEAPQ